MANSEKLGVKINDICGNCKEYVPFCKRIKGELKVTCSGHCNIANAYKKRTDKCKRFKINED